MARRDHNDDTIRDFNTFSRVVAEEGEILAWLQRRERRAQDSRDYLGVVTRDATPEIPDHLCRRRGYS